MELESGELRVHYHGKLNQDLDKELERVLRQFGFRLWASGKDLTTEVRDLAFEHKKPGSKRS